MFAKFRAFSTLTVDAIPDINGCIGPDTWMERKCLNWFKEGFLEQNKENPFECQAKLEVENGR